MLILYDICLIFMSAGEPMGDPYHIGMGINPSPPTNICDPTWLFFYIR
jgi:hypothetical protein